MFISRDHTPVPEKTSGFCKQKAQCLKGPATARAGLPRQKAKGISGGKQTESSFGAPTGWLWVGSFLFQDSQAQEFYEGLLWSQ